MLRKKIAIIGNSRSPHVFNRLTKFAKSQDLDFFLFDTNLNSDVEIPITRISNRIPELLNLPVAGTLFKLLWSLFRLQKVKPDTIFIMYCGTFSLFYSIFFKGKVILSFWGSDILSRNVKKKSFLLQSIQRKALLKADKIYCVSKELTDEVCKVAGKKLRTPPVLLMYGIDLELYKPLENKEFLRKEFLTIYSPRWCLPLYNIEAVIDAAIILLKAGRKIQLIYRNIDLNNSIESKRYSEGLADKIKKSGFESKFIAIGLLGNQEQINLMCDSDVVISVSHYDGTPLSILEAMACKTITVSGKIISTINFIDHSVNGYLVDKDNPLEIADQIALVMDEKNKQSHVRGNARSFVEIHANIEREVEDYTRSFRVI